MKIGPKYKISRRLGYPIFEKTKSEKYAMGEAKREANRRGIRKRRGNMSEYNLQLREKQKLRFSYGVGERQFRKYIDNATQKNVTDPSLKIFQQLEMRLDNVVYRLGLAPSRGASRQMVSHGHIDINGKRMKAPSYTVKKGDKISIRDRSKDKALYLEIDKKIADANIPKWLTFDVKKMEGGVTEIPVFDTLVMPFDLTLIIELYSR